MTTTGNQSDQAQLMLAIARSWPIVMFVGLMSIALGLAIVVWPSATLTVLSILLGVQLLLFGVYRLIAAFSSDTLSPGLSGFFGIISMMAGVIVLRHPFETVAVLATVLGVVWIVGGSIDLIGSIADSSLPNRGAYAIAGFLSIAAGVIVVAWPTPTVTVIAWVSGIYLMVIGILACVESLSLRKVSEKGLPA